jgi:hypothetical protein
MDNFFLVGPAAMLPFESDAEDDDEFVFLFPAGSWIP